MATFESETCTRCGGSGHYSYCQSYGTKCFRCRGKGRTLTARGAAASRYLYDLLCKSSQDVAPGETYYIPGLPEAGIKARWVKVAVTEPAESPKGFSFSQEAGGMVPWPVVPHVALIDCDGHRHVMPATALVRMLHTAEEKAPKVAAAIAYQDTLTKAGTVRKRAVKARAAGEVCS